MKHKKLLIFMLLIGLLPNNNAHAAEKADDSGSLSQQEEQKETADFESQAEALAMWLRTEQEKLRQENPDMVEFQGQAGGLKELGKITKEFCLSSRWESTY